jgi:hypothetical protein
MKSCFLRMRQESVRSQESDNSLQMIAPSTQVHYAVASETSLPSHLTGQFLSLSKCWDVWAVATMMVWFLADSAGVCTTLRTVCSVRAGLDIVGNYELGAGVVTAVSFVARSILHSGQLKNRNFVRIHMPGDQCRGDYLLAAPRGI